MPATIFICHPWAGNLKPTDYNPYPELTKKICRYLSKHTEDIPLSTGLYFNQFLYDDVDDERNLGINLGHELMKKCDVVYLYEMHGISAGMKEDVNIARKLNIPIKRFNKYPWQDIKHKFKT